MLACLSLTVPRLAIGDETSDSQSPALVESHRQGEASIVALLAKLERQVEEDRPASAQDDAVAETIADLLTLVPYAPPSDAKLILALPAHFMKRAREAEAGGRDGEANRFAMLGNLLADVFKPTDATDQQAPTVWVNADKELCYDAVAKVLGRLHDAGFGTVLNITNEKAAGQ